jgi:hypothetical protein
VAMIHFATGGEGVLRGGGEQAAAAWPWAGGGRSLGMGKAGLGQVGCMAKWASSVGRAE